MTNIFKPKVTRLLLKMLRKHSVVEMALEKTGLSLEAILKNNYLLVPRTFQLRGIWIVIGSTFGPDGDLIEKTLKLAWSYTTRDHQSDLFLAVCDELSAYQLAMELVKRCEQNRKNSKLLRPRIPAADEFIKKILNENLQAKKEYIWNLLPESSDDEDLYRDGEFLYDSSLPNKKLSSRVFELRVEKIRKTLNT